MELKNDELTVQFKEFGGALSSIKDKDGVEYLWQGDATYWSGQAPVLFPICGSVRNDTIGYKGMDLVGRIPRHGLVRKKDFKVESVSENSITFTITPDEEMLQNYPFQFELTIAYTLIGKTIRTEYRVSNHETKKVMPYFIGGHPGFNCPLIDDDYEDYYLEFEQEETCSVPATFPETGLLDVQERTPFLHHQRTLDLDYALFARDAVTLDQLQSRSVSLRSKKHDKGLRLDFADFPNLVLWSTTNKGAFVALEPWSGLSTSLEEGDIFEDKSQVSLIAPGQTQIKAFDITIF